MLGRNCNYLTTIAISVIVAFVFAILFYTGIITGITTVFIFALSLSLLSLLVVSIFGISDNGLTRTRLCQNYLGLILAILGNILFSLFALIIPLTAGTIASTVLVALGSFFFMLNLISLVALLLSVIRYE